MKLRIKNFKCFYDTEINLNHLTLFAGANGFGKSSAIQALLFMRHTIEHCSKWNETRFTGELDTNLKVDLNGTYCLSLGMSSDVIPIDAERNSIMSVEVKDDTSSYTVQYNLNDEKNQLCLNLKQYDASGVYCLLPIFDKAFYYLNAERLGPRTSNPFKFHDYPNVGYQGEYTAQILSQYGYKNDNADEILVDLDRRFNPDNKYLLHQVSEWMDYLMPGVTIGVKDDYDLQRAQIIVKNSFSNDKSVRSTNIGFGISYVLPIIVTGLLAKKGSIMIVENPEAHLHPSAQSRIGYFLSRVAQTGVYVIIETHSEHLLNGIQIAVAKEIINKDLVTINYFNTNDNRSLQVKEIAVSDHGHLSEWPYGFFDQTQRDYSILYRLNMND